VSSLICGVLWEPENWSIVRANERAGRQKQFIAKRPKREALPIVGKAYPLKRGHQVVGETNDFQVQAIGCKHVGMFDEGEIVAWFIPPIGY
jgi:hypothetical protein